MNRPIASSHYIGLPRWLSGERIRRACRRPRFDPWVGKIPWRSKWQLTPVVLPGKSHGQRRVAGYSPWGCKESDTTEHTHSNYINISIFSSWKLFPSICYFNTNGWENERKYNPIYIHIINCKQQLMIWK